MPVLNQEGSSSPLCWRICARVLRFQMATAIPPNAADVASRRPVRQRLLCSGGSPLSRWSIGSGRELVNLRIGMD